MKHIRTLILASLAVSLAGCGGGGGGSVVGPPPPVRTPKMFALDFDNQIHKFNLNTPGTSLGLITVSAPEPSKLVSIDYRVSDNRIIGLTDDNRIFSINPADGSATQIGTDAYEPVDSIAKQIEVEPATGNLRVISEERRNFRVSGTTGEFLGEDTEILFATGDPNEFETPLVKGVAFSGNLAGNGTGTLFAVDGAADALVRIGGPANVPPAAAGAATTLGQLNIDLLDFSGLEIYTSSTSEVAYLANNRDPLVGEFVSDLYTVNLATGAVSLVGAFAFDDWAVDIAIGFDN